MSMQLGHAAEYRPGGGVSTSACNLCDARYRRTVPRHARISGGAAALEA